MLLLRLLYQASSENFAFCYRRGLELRLLLHFVSNISGRQALRPGRRRPHRFLLRSQDLGLRNAVDFEVLNVSEKAVDPLRDRADGSWGRDGCVVRNEKPRLLLRARPHSEKRALPVLFSQPLLSLAQDRR